MEAPKELVGDEENTNSKVSILLLTYLLGAGVGAQDVGGRRCTFSDCGRFLPLSVLSVGVLSFSFHPIQSN